MIRSLGFWAILGFTVGAAGLIGTTLTPTHVTAGTSIWTSPRVTADASTPTTTSTPTSTSLSTLTPAAGNPGTVTITDPGSYSAVYAISDVHGMYGALLKLLTENHLTDANGHWTGGHSLLVVIGDSIDKGAQSIDVLDEWIRLQPEAEIAGGRVVHLLGNHEAEFLADPTPSDDKAKALFDELQSRGIPLEQLTSAQFPRGGFLRSLPAAARIGNWVFCHAGFLPDQSWDELTAQALRLVVAGSYGDAFFVGDDSLLESKKWWKIGSGSRAHLEARLDADGLAGVVFGHQPKALNIVGESAISDDGRLIKIDNGMAPEAGSHPGSLLLFTNPSELADSSKSGNHAPQVFTLVHGSRQPLAAESRVELSRK